MPWTRRRFKGNKVYVPCDAASQVISDRGTVEVRYKLGDTKGYRVTTASISELSEEDGGGKLWSDSEFAVASPTTSDETEVSGVKSAPPQPSATKSAPQRLSATSEGQKAKRIISFPGDAQNGPPYYLDRPPILLYTDGACSGNPGPAGIGVVLIYQKYRKEVAEYLGDATNNIAELLAIKRGLELIVDAQHTVVVYSDSKYALGMIAGWKAKKNQELIEALLKEAARFPDLRLIKVAGHAGVLENERCDALARQAIQTTSSSTTTF